jgi:hypothetical protein
VGTVVAGVDQGIDMITDGNQQVTGSTVININSTKAGIISDEHNYLIIGVAVGDEFWVILICAILICLVFLKKTSVNPKPSKLSNSKMFKR